MRDYILAPDRISTRSNCHDRYEVLKKDSKNPIFFAEKEWEGDIVGWPSFLYDSTEKLYKMWYLCIPNAVTNDKEILTIDNAEIKKKKNYICYATSKDGISWDRPIINKLEQEIYPDNNILFENIGRYIDGPSVIYDEYCHNKKEMYKMTYYEHLYEKQGVHTFVSEDGINWNEIGEFPVLPSQDALKFYYDKENKMFYLFLKDRILNRRSRLISKSSDFRNWSEPEAIISPNLGDSEVTNFYDMFAFKNGDITMAFLTIYDAATQTSHAELITGGREMNFRRLPSRPVMLNRGDDEDWDRGGIYTASGQLFEEENQIMKYYYYGSGVKHDDYCVKNRATTGFGIAYFVKNRLCGQQFLGEGEFSTVSIKVTGSKLYINGKSKSPFKVAIALCGYPKSYKGYDYSECTAITGDDHKHEVLFNGVNDISHFTGQYVKIKMKGKNSIIYSIGFE